MVCGLIAWMVIMTEMMLVKSQFSGYHGYSESLSRVPGLQPAIAYPEFLSNRPLHTSRDYTGSRSESMCPSVNRNCPRSCRKLDQKKCKICRCSEKQNTSYSSKPSSPTRCFPMVHCMLSCKSGYRLSESMDSNGCQACTCTGSQFTAPSQSHEHDRENVDTSWGTDETGSGPRMDANSNKDVGKDWGVSMGIVDGSEYTSTSHGTVSNKDSDKDWGMSRGMLDGSEYAQTSHRSSSSKDTPDKDWSMTMGRLDGSQSYSQTSHETNNFAGESTNRKPNSGINPMFPGASLSTGDRKESGSCTGPFCVDQSMPMAGGGAMGSMSSGGGAMGGVKAGSGASGGAGCTGPFCISGGMMGGANSGMGGSNSGMGGAGMGGMGGGMGGGMKGFSPFGLAASVGSSSGCNGPFCSMATMGGTGNKQTGSADEIKQGRTMKK